MAKGNYKGKNTKRGTSAKSSSTANVRFDSNSEARSNVDDTTTKDSRRRTSKSRGGNDPAWYASNPQLLRDAASIPFSTPLGSLFNDGSVRFDASGDIKPVGNDTIPGICTLKVTPSLGYSRDTTSPLNIASTAVYSFIRHANSGSSNYDAPDLMVYLTGMSQVYSYIVFLQRLYSSAFMYSHMNRYVPRAIIEAQGVSYDNILSNLANFRYGINMLIEKASCLAVPNTMTIYNRAAFLYQFIYAGGETAKDQLYQMAPNGFLKFEPLVKTLHSTTSAGASGLVFAELKRSDGELLTAQDLVDYGNDLLSTLIGNEDIGIMSGDILKAYTSANLIKLAPLPEVVDFAPVFNAMVLEQFKNARLIPFKYHGTVDNIDEPVAVYQSENKKCLLSNAEFAYEQSMLGNYDEEVLVRHCSSGKLLTTSVADPSPEIVIENTRLMPIILEDQYHKYTRTENSKEKVTHMYPIASGTEIPTHIIITKHKYTSNGMEPEHVTVDGNTYVTIASENTITSNIWNLPLLSFFKYHPEVKIWMKQHTDSVGSAYAVDFKGRIFDVDNYTILDEHELSRMHEAAFVSMLSVPSIAKTTTVSRSNNK